MIVQEFNPEFTPGARIKVIGVWGAGGNTINRMAREGLEGVEFVAVNTDAQTLANSLAHKKVNIGLNLTKGLWAGANPETGRKAAEETIDDIKAMLYDTDMVFVTAGMWGGTGTGAAPVIASIAKEMGILTVGVVTKPFSFEGKRRFQYALEGLEKMKSSVDTLIVIPNDKIFNIIDKKTTFKQAFSMIDKILYLGVQGISELITKPGELNIDYADVQTVMKGSGTALFGIGYGQGENRAVDAARRAVDNPLLEATLEGAKSILFAVTGGDDLTPIEVQEAARVIEEIADPDAMIIWGMTFDQSYEGEVKVSIIATGFPETIQESMIKNVGVRQSPLARLWSNRTQSGRNYVGQAMESEWVSTNVMWEATSVKEERDYETPPYLARKLLSEKNI